MSNVNVNILRLSYVSGVIHNRLDAVGGDFGLDALLADPSGLADVPVTLPFADDLPVEKVFWSRIVEKKTLSAPLPSSVVKTCRIHNLPLRHSGTLTVDPPGSLPRAEVYIYRFGVIACTTVDLRWDQAQPLEQVSTAVDILEQQSVQISVGPKGPIVCPLSEAAGSAAAAVAAALSGPGEIRQWDLPVHRLATVINGAREGVPNRLPVQGDEVHAAMHYLSGGSHVLADPKSNFVPQWSGGGYVFPPASLVYMLDSGTSALLSESLGSVPRRGQPASDWHRERLLLLGYTKALAALVVAAPKTPVGTEFRSWAEKAAKTLSLLYGPMPDYKDWGLFAAALLQHTGVRADVEAVLGKALEYNSSFTTQQYP